MWKLGKHCPFQIGGEIVKLPVNRKKKKIFFSLIGWQFLQQVKHWFCNVLMIPSGFGVSQCRAPTAALSVGAGSGWQHHGLGAAGWV